MGNSFLDRRVFLAAGGAFCLSGAQTFASTHSDETQHGISYLEHLGQPGALPTGTAYHAPSKVDAAYSHVIYVNTATRGAAAQKMWILARNAETPTGWQLALWDQKFWSRQGLPEGETPPYSWPVSTGRKYPGDRRSGPTPVGIFNMDDRRTRHRRGWASQGMYNSIYIDLHYSSGRASGIAMHGTTSSKYRRLGRVDSHGCIRMTQRNSQKIWDMFHPANAKGAASPYWGEVPRYFTSKPKQDYSARFGYVRDGSFLYSERAPDVETQTAQLSERLSKSGYTALFIFFRDDL